MPGFGSVGVWEVILILAILLLVFGAKRLPEIGSALGKGIREFKGSIREIEGEIKRPGDQGAPRDLPRSEAPRAEPRTEAPRAESAPRETESAGTGTDADRRPE
ncbi:MAG: twin-arginine translocase TatA/TatE family subunit [Gemmatimonadetes bacterium]|nr:twin-arginine translocase TatA/TatE family subunit [Gemmatimonadota bacterium]